MLRHAMIWTIIPVMTLAGYTSASDWMGFRGPGTRGISEDTGLAVTWSETENLKWKTPLPGPGSSSPIVMDEKVFVTCYSGYGLHPDKPGDANDLKRHLLCIRATDGKVLWDKTVPAILPENPYRGMFRQHGYASQTPVTDGQRIYVFFGKSGVLAFDLSGKQLWQSNVGTGSDQKLWGSAASPALYKNMVIVNAWDESKTLYALDKKTGREIWKKDLSETGLSFSTPVMAEQEDGRVELVVSLSSQVWGLDPDTGKSLWFTRTNINETMIPTPVILEGVAYIHGGGPRSSGSLAVRIGGKGDVTDTHIVWSSKEVTSGPSPVIVNGLMYWVDASGKACCLEAKTGKLRYSEKLPVKNRFAVYASAAAAEGRLYVVTRKIGTFVLAARPKFQIIAQNKFPSDNSDFNASPAVSNRRMFLRSNQFLYCLQKTR
ncbi:MAG: PQQ-binding-like beta-propeller repeat protein [Planctomycetes bacterium]|nr:PQQ-binding-like beta-propeller repeat protein [Planctomycetota bacterium]